MKHRIKLAPHVFSSKSLKEIEQRFSRVDVAVSDLDQCLFPGFSQVALTVAMFKSLLREPRLSQDLKIKFKILDSVLYGVRVKLKSLIGVRPQHNDLIRKYEEIVEEIPREYFFNAARLIPALSYRYGFQTLQLLSRTMPTGIITMSIGLIMWEYVRQFTLDDKPVISFYDANRISFNTDDDNKVFEGYSEHRFILSADDKLNAMMNRLEQLSAGCPLVIGHNMYEIPMVRAAREMSGISLGFNPAKSVEQEFDIVVRARDWKPIYQLFKSLQARTGKKEEE